MQIDIGDLLVLERSVSMTYAHQLIYALVVKKTFVHNGSHCDCILLIDGLERRAHVFVPKGKNWTKIKTIAHIFAPSREEQKTINIGNIWGDFNIKQTIKVKEEQ